MEHTVNGVTYKGFKPFSANPKDGGTVCIVTAPEGVTVWSIESSREALESISDFLKKHHCHFGEPIICFAEIITN